jgi:hypothetical protein
MQAKPGLPADVASEAAIELLAHRDWEIEHQGREPYPVAQLLASWELVTGKVLRRRFRTKLRGSELAFEVACRNTITYDIKDDWFLVQRGV